MTPLDFEEIREGNKLIAEFMDVKYYQSEEITAKLVSYHTSWDWLMPVVEKIEKDISSEPWFGFTVDISDHYCCIRCHEKNRQDGVVYQTPYGYKPQTKLSAVWEAVVQFIQCYNQNKKS